MTAIPANPARSKHPKPAHVQQGVMHGTPATRQLHALALGGTRTASTPRRKHAGKKKAAQAPHRKTSRPRATAARSGRHHLVKGSAAAKRRMAQLRAMQGKKAAAA